MATQEIDPISVSDALETGKFFDVMLANFIRLLPLPQGQDLDRANKAILDLVIDGKSDPFSHTRSFTAEQDAFAEIFRWYLEIEDVRHRLSDYEHMIRRAPYKRIGISVESYFRVVVTGYLNDVYALHERLKGYLNTIGKLYGRDARNSDALKRCHAVCRRLKESSLVNARGQHTHALTFADEKLKRVSTIRLLTVNKAYKELGTLHPEAVREFKKKWVTVMTTSTPAISKAVTHVYELSFPVLFEANVFKSPR